MTDTSSTKTSPSTPTSLGTWIGVGLTYGMFAIAGLMGLLVFYAGLRLIVTGEQHWGVGLLVTAMGIIFASIGIGFFYFQFIKAPAMRARGRALEARYPGQPWMLRRDWAARRVTDSAIGGVIFMWIWVAGWWGAILFIWTMKPRQDSSRGGEVVVGGVGRIDLRAGGARRSADGGEYDAHVVALRAIGAPHRYAAGAAR